MKQIFLSAGCIFLLLVTAKAQSPVSQLVREYSGLTQPLLLTHAGDGSYRRFIIEKAGRILVSQGNSAATSLFMDIQSKVLLGDEQGLLGLAFHPSYAANGRFFVNYTRKPDGATVIAEYAVTTGNPNTGNSGSEKPILVISQPYPHHNGGMIAFGQDGFLYIGMGDGGSSFDPDNRAQNINELLGKVLRIDIDHPASQTVLYTSPATNPFFGAVPGRDEIYAMGFRNPWRWSFDRSSGALYVADVGQNAREEVDVVTLGGNYGWRVWEGTSCTGLGTCTTAGYTFPIFEYSHTGGRCSITGGFIYRGAANSLPAGAYVYGDYCSGEVFMLRNGTASLLFSTGKNIVSFGEDERGEIYVVSYDGVIQRIRRKFSSEVTSQ